MFFLEETQALLEKSIGKSLEEISQMDLDEEIAFVEKKIGRKLRFSTDIDPRMISRGNPLLAQGKFLINEKTGARFEWLRKLLRKRR